MHAEHILGGRVFGIGDQLAFAEISGDRNPIHVDPIAVRRMLPARLVVHGMHVLLWVLETIARSGISAAGIEHIQMRFPRFTYVGDHVSLKLIATSDRQLRIQVVSNALVRGELKLAFGTAKAPPIPIASQARFLFDAGPIDHAESVIDGHRGTVLFSKPVGAFAAMFPAAMRWLGERRVTALAGATRLVGMICPGLHSILGGIDLRACEDDEGDGLAFEMGELRHGQIDATVCGGGIVGMLDCRVSNPPVQQRSCRELRDLVHHGRYKDANVLIIGGSRGVGEAAAKLLTLGGATVRFTFRDGADDAAAVADDIRASGGSCDVQRYDAAESALAQLGSYLPTHAIWCASPSMLSPNLVLSDDQWASECRLALVSGVSDLSSALDGRGGGLRILYPSNEALASPPMALVDYMMAKASAEILAHAIGTTLRSTSIFMPRLPAMATDQTARLNIEAADAALTIRPCLDALIGSA